MAPGPNQGPEPLAPARAADAVRGVFAGRVPNAVSPLGGHIRADDFTHQTSLTASSIR